jgi:DNA-binding transcriptional MerR regulator
MRSRVHHRLVSHGQTDGPLRIGALAARSGVSPDTLRHYERRGLLPPLRRSPAGYRLYGPEAVARVAIIRAGLAVGLTLAELAEVVRLRDGGHVPCRRVRTLVAGKLRDLEDRLREIENAKERIQELLAAWDARLAATPPGHRAGLLEALATTEGGPRRPHPLHAPVPRRNGASRGRKGTGR